MKILKKIITFLQYTILIIGIGFSIFGIIQSFTMEGLEFFGPLLNIFLFIAGFVYIFYTIVVIAILELIYSFIEKLNNLYKKRNKSNY